jgi:dihydrofolate reductase
MTISLVVAAAENDVIGKRGTLLPWHLRGDLLHFKTITTGHPIIMGRKTFQTIGRPLPGRHNIIITNNPEFKAEGCSLVDSLDAAIELAAKESDEVFITGGGKIFEQALPKANKIYLTRVHAQPHGDVYFHYDPAEWRETDHEKHSADGQNDHDYTFITLTRI